MKIWKRCCSMRVELYYVPGDGTEKIVKAKLGKVIGNAETQEVQE